MLLNIRKYLSQYKGLKKLYWTLRRVMHKFLSKAKRLPGKFRNLFRVAHRYLKKRKLAVYANRIAIVPGRILFFAFQNNYACNPKYICEELIRQQVPVELVWCVDQIHEEIAQAFPKQVRLVEYGTTEYEEALHSALIWIDNGFYAVKDPFLIKKSQQVYIQTLHGSLGIKKIDAKAIPDKARNRRARLCGKLTDYCISNSRFETEVYRTSFWPDAEILEYGHARNDMILNKEPHYVAEVRKKLLDYYHLDEKVKTILWAPTFSDDSGERKSQILESFDYTRLLTAFQDKTGETWAVLARLHPRDHRHLADGMQLPDCVVNAGDYPDMQELIIAADIGITDFSSWIFDFVITGKPGFIFAPSLTSYESQQGFYYPIQTTPFPVASTPDQLYQNVTEFDAAQYADRVRQFLDEKGCVEDGKACARVVSKIKEIIAEKRA